MCVLICMLSHCACLSIPLLIDKHVCVFVCIIDAHYSMISALIARSINIPFITVRLST